MLDDAEAGVGRKDTAGVAQVKVCHVAKKIIQNAAVGDKGGGGRRACRRPIR